MNDTTAPTYAWYLRYLPALAWPLIIVGLCVEIHLRFDPVTPYLFEQCGVYQQLPDADTLHQQVLDCYRGTGQEADQLTDSRFQKSEISHFRDVSFILTLLRWASGTSLVIMIGASILHPLRYQWIRIGFYYFCALNLALALIGSRWLLLFRGMHPLAFSGTTWDFHPTDLILQLYPETYLAAYASVICISSLILALILFTWAQYKDNSTLWSNKHFTWHKKLGDASLVIALFAVPVYLSGQYMIHPWGYEWSLYWTICLAICAACCSVVILRNLACSAMLILATAILLQCFAFGVRSSTASAQFGLKTYGQLYKDAINAYKKEHQEYPADLQTLYAYDEKLPQKIPQPFHPLHYVNQGHKYYFYFTGPLAYEFSYHSDSDYWNFMRLP